MYFALYAMTNLFIGRILFLLFDISSKVKLSNWNAWVVVEIFNMASSAAVAN